MNLLGGAICVFHVYFVGLFQVLLIHQLSLSIKMYKIAWYVSNSFCLCFSVDGLGMLPLYLGWCSIWSFLWHLPIKKRGKKERGWGGLVLLFMNSFYLWKKNPNKLLHVGHAFHKSHFHLLVTVSLHSSMVQYCLLNLNHCKPLKNQIHVSDAKMLALLVLVTFFCPSEVRGNSMLILWRINFLASSFLRFICPLSNFCAVFFFFIKELKILGIIWTKPT